MSLDRTRLKALEAALVSIDPPAAARVPRLVDGPPRPEEPTVTLPLRVAREAETALCRCAAQLEAAARACGGDTQDRAGAWGRWSSAATALESLRPLVEAARQENRRRWAEHNTEWHRMRREANGPRGEVA